MLRTDRRTDGQTDGQAQTNMPPQLLRSWGHNQPIPFPMDHDGHDFQALFQYRFYTWVKILSLIESFFNKSCQTRLVMQRHVFHLKLSTVL